MSMEYADMPLAFKGLSNIVVVLVHVVQCHADMPLAFKGLSDIVVVLMWEWSLKLRYVKWCA